MSAIASEASHVHGNDGNGKGIRAIRHVERHLDELGSCGSQFGYTTAEGEGEGGYYYTTSAEGDADSNSDSEYDSDCTLVEKFMQLPSTVKSPLALMKASAFAPPTVAAAAAAGAARSVRPARPATPVAKKRVRHPRRVRVVSPAPMVVGGLVSWLSESEGGHVGRGGGGTTSAVESDACNTDSGQHWSLSESDPGWSDHSRCPSDHEHDGDNATSNTSSADATDPDTDACDNSSERGNSPPVTPSRRRARSWDGPSTVSADGLRRVGGSSNSLSSAAGSGSDEADDCWTVSPHDPEHEWDLDMSQVTGGITFDVEKKPLRRSSSADSSTKNSGRKMSMRSMVKSLLEI